MRLRPPRQQSAAAEHRRGRQGAVFAGVLLQVTRICKGLEKNRSDSAYAMLIKHVVTASKCKTLGARKKAGLLNGCEGRGSASGSRSPGMNLPVTLSDDTQAHRSYRALPETAESPSTTDVLAAGGWAAGSVGGAAAGNSMQQDGKGRPELGMPGLPCAAVSRIPNQIPACI